MIRPTGTDAISMRHSSLDSSWRAEPSEYMTFRMRGEGGNPQGRRSLLAGTVVRFGAVLEVVAEHPHRVGGRLGPALHAQLGEQRRHVILHRLLRQEHPLTDLPVRQPLPDQ